MGSTVPASPADPNRGLLPVIENWTGIRLSAAKKEAPPPPVPLKGPRVAVVDSFTGSGIDINDDWFSDISHGSLVGLHIRERVPGVNIMDLDVHLTHRQLGLPEDTSGQANSAEQRLRRSRLGIAHQFNALAKEVQSGKPLAAVNMSLGSVYMAEGKGVPVTIEVMAKETGLPLTAENLGEYRAEIRKKLQEWAAAKDPAKLTDFQRQAVEYAAVLDAIESVTRQGVPVYIAAGNQPDFLNIYGLAAGVRLIGAQDAKGKTASFSAKNGLIDRQARGVYPATPIRDGETLLGYDLTGDNKVDIPARQISFGGRVSVRPFLHKYLSFEPYGSVDGTSFASPTALAEDLNSVNTFRELWADLRQRFSP